MLRKSQDQVLLHLVYAFLAKKKKILAFRILKWLLNFQKILAVRRSDLLLTFRHNIYITFDIVLVLKIFQQCQKC